MKYDDFNVLCSAVSLSTKYLMLILASTTHKT